ncbi:Outer membrane protein SypB [Pseudoalteromonas luteoviolacea B = ATCC 29581]|nr:Outer membrane protein SypB [Pseudoalteromonas luteoviolacea B = ATCC 29581]
MNRVLGTAIFVLSLSGCSSWPEEGRGGWAEYSLNTDRDTSLYQQSEDAILTEFEHMIVKLDALEGAGLGQCMPGQLVKVKLFETRIKRAIAAELWQDVERDMIQHYHMLNQLSMHFDLLKRNTHCVQDAFAESEQPIIDVITVLLNSDNQFETDDVEITAKYQVNLAKAADLMKQISTRDLLLVGNADTRATEGYNYELALKRADAVKHWLVLYGLDSERIVTLTRGERGQTGKTKTQMLNDRRVDAILIEPGISSQPHIPLKKWSAILEAQGVKEGQ